MKLFEVLQQHSTNNSFRSLQESGQECLKLRVSGCQRKDESPELEFLQREEK